MDTNQTIEHSNEEKPVLNHGFDEPIPPTSKEGMDAAITVLHANKDKWINLDIDQKTRILDQILIDLNEVAGDWVFASLRAKRAPENSFCEGEEWFYLAIINRLIRLYKNSLVEINNHGRPSIPGPLKALANGQIAAQVFPQTFIDRILLRDTTCEIYMDPDLNSDQIIENQAKTYRHENPTGKITLALGAGNTSFLIPGDFLHKLFVEGHVVLLKPNPVNEYLGPLIEQGFKALIEPGFLQVVYGGGEQGAYLSHHPQVDELHMTGSHRTFETIVFGSGPQGQQRKAARDPVLTKRFTAELGNITPIIVVPGEWSASEIESQGVKIASWLVYNGGYACTTPRLIIQSKNWSHRQPLNQSIAQAFTQVDTRYAYYPGSEEVQGRFIGAHPDALQIGNPAQGHLPWTFITDVDSQNVDDICFNEEPFCSLFSETSIEAEKVPQFIDRAVSFVNENVWGTLHAIIIVHPSSLKDPQVVEALEKAIQNLRYGTVSVNQYPAISYYVGLTTWGSFPGQDIYDIQSGIGFVNNTLMFSNPQKSVLRAPFTLKPDPFVISTLRAHEFGRKLAAYEVNPSIWKLPSIIWTVLRSPHEHVFKKSA